MAWYFILLAILPFSSAPVWCDAEVVFGTKEGGRIVERESSSSSNSSASSLFGSGGGSSSGSSESNSSASSSSSVFMGRSVQSNDNDESSSGRSGSTASSVFSSSSKASSSEENDQQPKASKGASSVFGSAGKKHNRNKVNKNSEQKHVEDAKGNDEKDKEDDKNDKSSGPEEGKPMPENPRKMSKFLWPVDGGRVTSFFGWRSSSRFHDGIDIAAPKGTKIFATKSGQVIYSDNRIRGYGNMIVIRHNEGYHSVYSHNSSNKVRKGNIVSQGDVIGTVGNTGHSSGPHLHFEIRKGKYSKDPLKFLGSIPSNKGAYKDSDGASIFAK